MVTKSNDEKLGTAVFVHTGLAVLLLFWLLAATVNAQTTETIQPAAATQTPVNVEKPAPVLIPLVRDYKGITLGTTAQEVKDKLGKAEISDKEGFYYEFDNDEAAQIRLDDKKKVFLISITYSVKDANAPKFANVFGADVAADAKPDGSIYKLIRYPEAGYWVAYSRTAGDNATITVTMQKL